MIEINLIPDVKQELIKAQRMRSMVVTGAIFTSIISVGVVVLLLVYVFVVQLGRGIIVDNQIKDKAADLAKVEDLSQMVTIQNQLGKISSLNDQKAMTSRVFDVLSAVSQGASQYQNDFKVSQLNVDTEEQTIRIEGQTSGYDAMEVFKKTVAGAILVIPGQDSGDSEDIPVASNISTSDVSYGEDTDGKKVLRFVLSFNYAEELFDSKSDIVGIKINVNGNVTDSYLGLPKSLFTEPAKDLGEDK